MKGTSTATELCEELNFTYSSPKSSLPALSLSSFQCVHMAYERPLCSHEIADKFIENDCESRTLCRVYISSTAFHSLSLSLTLSVSFLCCLSLALSVPVALGCMFPSCNMQEFLRKNIDDLANVH